jgi:EAL domain-containing protein (putative c-di-GMP-specific phosphodiesterase class I)/GGDEF domain-containing protein/PAS domain-containing protein
MPVQSLSLTLLLLTSDTPEAERLIGRLRELGLPARALVTIKVHRLDELVRRRGYDAMIWWGDDDDGGELEGALLRRSKQAAEIPLILISVQDTDGNALAKARRIGARDLVRRGDDERLAWAIQREAADLRQRRQLGELRTRLGQCERRSRELVDRGAEAIAFVQDGLHLYANAAYLRLLGYRNLGEAQAVPFLDLIVPEQRDAIRELMRDAEHLEQTEPLESRARLRIGADHELEASLSVVHTQLEGEPCLRLILDPARSPGVRAGARIKDERLTTRAGELLAFFTEIESRLGPDRSVPHPFAVFFVRVLRLADLQRDIGLTHGLELVERVGELLGSIIGEPHVLARVSDDGFAMIIDGLDEKAAEARSSSILEEIRLPERSNTRNDLVARDCQVGYCLVRGHAAAAEDILNAAYRLSADLSDSPFDSPSGMQTPTSLAARKKQGAVDGESEMAETILTAVSNERLRLVYQPIISLMGDSQENYSVLVRLLDEGGSLLEAKDFIGAAIRSGLIEEIDKWSIRSAIQSLGEQRRAGHQPRFFINLAEDTFRNPGIVLWICDCLREFDVRGHWLTFQFQEETDPDNLAVLDKLVQALRQIKCRVAINRFGATKGSETLLQALPVDFVVIMPDYARGLADDPAKQQRLLGLAKVAREFNVKSVVAGVEDARALTVLWTAGVDYVQGNFIQRPSPTLEVQA